MTTPTKRAFLWLAGYLAIYAAMLALLAKFEPGFEPAEPLMVLAIFGGGLSLIAWLLTLRQQPLPFACDASPRTLVIETSVVSFATRITQIPRPSMSSDDRPTMNNVNRSWYLLLIKRFFQLRL